MTALRPAGTSLSRAVHGLHGTGRNAAWKCEPVRFALDEARPIATFADIKAPGWMSAWKMKEGEVTVDL